MSCLHEPMDKPPEILELDAVRSVRVSPGAKARLVALTEEQSLGSEQFRVLAAHMMNKRNKPEPGAVQVVSAGVGEGKTLISVNLAITLARHFHQRVLLVEGDLRRPSLGQLFGPMDWTGLAQWWAEGTSPLANYLYRLPDLSLWVLPSGGSYEHPADVLQSERLREAFSALVNKSFEWVIVDSTPILAMADANLWARMVHGMLLVVREGKTTTEALKRGLRSMDSPNLIGVVLNEASALDQADYQRHYYRKIGTGQNGHKKQPRETGQI